MRTIAKLFGRSPFVPLQSHMEKVVECVRMLPEILDAYDAGDEAKVGELAKTISKLEHKADLIKHDIRNSLPRGIFMPVDRENILRILMLQDLLANRAEDLAVLLTFKIAKSIEPFRTTFREFVDLNLVAFESAHLIIGQIDELLETGFGGSEAQKVKVMVDEVAEQEYQADLRQHELLRLLLANEDEFSKGDFFLWTRIIEQASAIGNLAEDIALAVRLTLEWK